MFDTDTTEQHDLREGRSPWRAATILAPFRPLTEHQRCDVLVVGAGITGALVAHHLTTLGQQVCLVDRERPAGGSTIASTAMLLWEIDTSLAELSDRLGFEAAADIYRRSVRAVDGLAALALSLGDATAFRTRPSLYLAAKEIGARELMREHEVRRRASLPGEYLDHATLMRSFGLDRAAAILSSGAAEIDPLALTHALINEAASQGARLAIGNAMDFLASGTGVVVGFEGGVEIEASHVVLATGYVMPDFVRSDVHRAKASFAMATAPQPPGVLWTRNALIWEASKDYLYARTTADGRIIIGGEDEDGALGREERAVLAPGKSEALARQLSALLQGRPTPAELVWSGAFGETVDGLPLIGAVPGWPRILAAYGYGGNGITFSYMASRMIAALIAGVRQPWFRHFAIDRTVA